LTSILQNPEKVLTIIGKELAELKEKTNDPRRTKIYKQKIGEFSDEDLIAKEDVLITVTRTGYIKRVPRATFRSQRRGGKGIIGMEMKEEDEIWHLVSATTHDTILFFTDKGKVYGARAWELPEASRQSKGQAVVNILNLDQGETIMAILPMSENGSKHIIMATAKGVVKKTAVSEFKNMRTSGLIAIKLDSKDYLVSVQNTSGEDHILLLTKKGKAIRFPEANVRAMGRATSGMRGIKLEANDEVIGMDVFKAKEAKPSDKRRKFFRDILTLSEKGIGKRTAIHLFPVQKRAGKGVKAAVVNDKTGNLVAMTVLTQDFDQVVITSTKGQVIKLPIKNIPQMGRATQGVIMMRFAKKSDTVAAVAALEKASNDKEEVKL
jgi:DNA gyrase subunit A